jgi:hypothetical protein
MPQIESVRSVYVILKSSGANNPVSPPPPLKSDPALSREHGNTLYIPGERLSASQERI